MWRLQRSSPHLCVQDLSLCLRPHHPLGRLQVSSACPYDPHRCPSPLWVVSRRHWKVPNTWNRGIYTTRSQAPVLYNRVSVYTLTPGSGVWIVPFFDSKDRYRLTELFGCKRCNVWIGELRVRSAGLLVFYVVVLTSLLGAFVVHPRRPSGPVSFIGVGQDKELGFRNRSRLTFR